MKKEELKNGCCPICESTEVLKVIYFGLPMHLCEADGCYCLFGFWSFMADLDQIITNESGYFAFQVYEGSYWPALWHWLFGNDDDDPEVYL